MLRAFSRPFGQAIGCGSRAGFFLKSYGAAAKGEDRMVLYRFEKWYFDALSESGDFIFLYIVRIRFAGLSQWSISVSVSAGDGSAAETASATGTWKGKVDGSGVLLNTPYGMVHLENSRGRISLNIHNITVELDLDFGLNKVSFLSAVVVSFSGSNRISWAPIPRSAKVFGRISVNDRNLDMNNAHGYADYVFSNIFPRMLPIQTVLWGRLHHPDMFLTYTLLTGRDPGKQWGGMVVHIGESTTILDQLSLDIQQKGISPVTGLSCPAVYALCAQSHGCRMVINARHVQCAVKAEFVKNRGRGGRIADYCYRWISRDPRGEKYFSQAMATFSANGRDLVIEQTPCIDEYVVFN